MKKLICLVALVGVMGFGRTSPAFGDEIFPPQAPPSFVYSVKYLCGLQTLASNIPPNEHEVAPGNYATAINIHNFHGLKVSFRKMAVVADPQRNTRGPKSPNVNESLGPNEALEVDCIDIVQLFPQNALGTRKFIKGFLQIVSPVAELSVVAVYTAQPCFRSEVGCSISDQQLALEVVPQRPFKEVVDQP